MLKQFNPKTTNAGNGNNSYGSDPSDLDASMAPASHGSPPEPRMIPIRRVVRLAVAFTLVSALVAGATLGSLAYANTSNKFHGTRTQLHQTQKNLASTQADLAATRAKRDEYLRKLNATEAKLTTANNKLSSLQGKLSTTQSKLSSANQTLSIQGSQISTLKKCLSGISTSYSFFLDGNMDMALAALEASGPACDTASKYL